MEHPFMSQTDKPVQKYNEIREHLRGLKLSKMGKGTIKIVENFKLHFASSKLLNETWYYFYQVELYF